MKTFLISLFTALFLSFGIIAQDTIPNGSFEYWVGSNIPANWETTNQFLPPGIFTIKQVNSSMAGDFAMQLQTVDLDGSIIPGVATLGTLDIGSSYGGIPFTERPTNLTGFVKHPSKANEVAIYIEFKNAGETIGFGAWTTTDSIGDFEPLTIPITFLNNLNPDTLNITILTDPFFPGSLLSVDGLQFNFPTTKIEQVNPQNVHVYPNPCSNTIYVDHPGDAIKKITITDLNGRLVYTENIKNALGTIRINTDFLERGIYMLSAVSGTTYYRQKIIKQ